MCFSGWMIRNLRSIQSLFLLLVIVLASSCSSAIIKEEDPAFALLGYWRLNKEETLREIYRNRGGNFDSLERTEQWQAKQSFQFDFFIHFEDDGNWQGHFENRGKRSDAGGVFQVITHTGDEMQLQTSESADSGGETEIIDIRFVTKDQILLSMSDSGGGTMQLVLDRSTEDANGFP